MHCLYGGNVGLSGLNEEEFMARNSDLCSKLVFVKSGKVREEIGTGG